MNRNNRYTIGMLLDIGSIYGNHQSRLAPWLTTGLIVMAPILIYVYAGAFRFIPIYIFLPLEIIFGIRVLMIIPGREKYRVNIFRRTLHDQYIGTADMLNIATIHEDGLVEYSNGTVMYLVACYNGTCLDEIQRTIQIRRLLEGAVGDYEFDTYIQNINDSPALRAYYDKVANFQRNTSARNFINIIDHSLELVEDTSVVQCTIFAIRAPRSDWKTLRQQLVGAVSSKAARCYKTISIVDDPLVVNDIINRDIDSIINMQDLTRKKYATGVYASSKVLAFDLEEDQEIIVGKDTAVKVVEDKAPTESFHVVYEDRADTRLDINRK